MRILLLILLGVLPASADDAATAFHRDVRPLLSKYCFACHGREDPDGNLSFELIETREEIEAAWESWEAATEHLTHQTMPPEGEAQPTANERDVIISWYSRLRAGITPRPALYRPRRLSVEEYRNTLRTVFGFELEVAIIEAEQTLTERSMVRKLMPVDPPGPSGFRNDTYSNPISLVAWDQYSLLTDRAIQELLSDRRVAVLERFVGPISDSGLTRVQAADLLTEFAERTIRRTPAAQRIAQLRQRIMKDPETEVLAVLVPELKALLMSPQFLYRGTLQVRPQETRGAVDQFELAERLSYFLWADMPDAELLDLAARGELKGARISQQIDRMLKLPGARSLSQVFASEWLTLGEIEHVSRNPPVMLALKSQPHDFMHYLFTANRPLLELIDSQTAFINVHTRRMYGKDAQQLPKYVKQKGIEIEAVPNGRITLNETKERGGILTMPGVLAMNRGPILRGTWILERILGDELPEPPPDVGQVQPNRNGAKLTFRERFEQHRSQPACAVCHDKIDPLGFAFQEFGSGGQFLRSSSYRPPKKNRTSPNAPKPGDQIDTSGQLPTGEKFSNVAELKRILVTSQRDRVTRNIVKRTMSYALCRKLSIYDQPIVDDITEQMMKTDGTWRDLFVAIAESVPFREAIWSSPEGQP